MSYERYHEPYEKHEIYTKLKGHKTVINVKFTEEYSSVDPMEKFFISKNFRFASHDVTEKINIFKNHTYYDHRNIKTQGITTVISLLSLKSLFPFGCRR